MATKKSKKDETVLPGGGLINPPVADSNKPGISAEQAKKAEELTVKLHTEGNLSSDEFAELQSIMQNMNPLDILKLGKATPAPSIPVTVTVPDAASKASVDSLLASIQSGTPDKQDGSSGIGNEMMKGSEKDSHFLVIAKKSGLKLGIRPLTIVIKESPDRSYLYLAFRMRCEAESPDATTITATEDFGMPFRSGSSPGATHMSIECGVRLVQMPASPAAAYKQWQDNFVTQGMVAQLVEHLKKHKATMTVSEDQIVEYLNLTYDMAIPNVEEQNPTEFPLVFGLLSKK